MIKRILLDLDDVLNAFTPFALNYIGCDIGKTDYSALDPAHGYDIVAAANAKHHSQFTAPSFWGSMPRSMWATVPKSKEFSQLVFDSAACVGQENVFIVTTATESPECLAGKLNWIHENCPTWLHRQYLMGGPHKYLLANYETLLIDDNTDNVDSFRINGGHAVLMPRPWNRYHDIEEKNIPAYFELIFKRLFGGVKV